MNKEQYLLTCLMEECAEVAHRASKAIRFGLGESQRDQDKTNAERLAEELKDLFSVAMLLDVEGFTNIGLFDFEHFKMKEEKIDRYMAYSQELGRVNE